MHARQKKQTCIHIQHAYTCKHTHAYKSSHKRTCTYKYMQTNVHIQTHTNMKTYTHTHTSKHTQHAHTQQFWRPLKCIGCRVLAVPTICTFFNLQSFDSCGFDFQRSIQERLLLQTNAWRKSPQCQVWVSERLCWGKMHLEQNRLAMLHQKHWAHLHFRLQDFHPTSIGN